MALFVVATPIGNPEDFSLRALRLLKDADLIVGEELKALRQILKAAKVQALRTDQLNEHSRPEDIQYFVAEAKTKNVVLVSDCGTPGFCDPGAELVKACSLAGVAIYPVPGPSSLMALLSVCGHRVDQFTFMGFLPAKKEERLAEWKKIERILKQEKRPIILLETPYRCEKLVEDLQANTPNQEVIVGINLTQETEKIIRGKSRDLAKLGPFTDAEPIVLILP